MLTIADSTTETGILQSIAAWLADPVCRTLLLLAVIGGVAAWIYIKWYRPSRLLELETKRDIEASRTTQTLHIRDTAATQERAALAAAAVLERAEDHLASLADLLKKDK